MSKFEVGDLCVTQNTTASLLNNGLLVVILAIDPTRFGGTTPYLIRRIDGEQIPASLDMVSGVPNFFSGEIAWAAEHKLRPADRNEVLAILEKLAPLAEPA
ncbi:MAG: hypothetical protein KA240_12410 [Nitrospira sp.]|nr:hypothetical protein [Nitrospira sp.]